MFYCFSDSFENLRALQHLNVSYNRIDWFELRKCSSSKKTLETIDLSNNGAYFYPVIIFTFLSECAQFKNIYLRNNHISSINYRWNIFHKSLRVLDLSKNEISDLSVSKIFF